VEDVVKWARDMHQSKRRIDIMDEVDGNKRGRMSMGSMQSTYPEISANGALALIAVACSLLDRQIAAQEKTLLKEGGFTERLYRIRKARK
jgi:four helix bundle suffix protein